MIRRSLILLSFLWATVFGFSSGAYAGTSRSVALGGDTDFFTDTANVSRWYSSLLNFPNQVQYELGDVVHGDDFALSNQGLIGHGGSVYFRPVADGSYGTLAFTFQDNLKLGPTDGAFSAYWARKFGAFQVGFGGSFSTFGVSQVGSAIGDWSDSQYFHQYGLGFGYEISPGVRVELAGEIVNSMTGGAGATYSLPLTDDWGTVGLRMRSYITISDELTLLPVLDYFSDVRSGLDLNGNRPVDIDAQIFKIGAGANLLASSEMLLVFSAEYRQGKDNKNWEAYNAGTSLWDSSQSDFYQIRLRSGVETQVLPWLKVRASVKYVRVHEESILSDEGTSERDESYYYEYVKTPVAFGVGLFYGGINADFTFNDTPPLAETGRLLDNLGADGGDGYSALTLTWKF